MSLIDGRMVIRKYHNSNRKGGQVIEEPNFSRLLHVTVESGGTGLFYPSAIVGASKPVQLDGSLPAVDLRLDEEEMKFLDGIWYTLPRVEDPRVALR